MRIWPWRSSNLLGLFLLVGPLSIACGDAGDPAGPDPSGPTDLTLESEALPSGGTAVLAWGGFAGLEQGPRVVVDGAEVDARRLDDIRIEFDVPVRPAGSATVEVLSPESQPTTISARVLGVSASGHVFPCFVPPSVFAFIPVGGALYFEGYCGTHGAETSEQGLARVLPELPAREFEWIPEGYAEELSFWWLTAGPSTRPNHFVARVPGPDSLPPDYRLWVAGSEPRPVESLDCYSEVPDDFDHAAPVELGDGSCLLYAPYQGIIYRDGQPLIEMAFCCDVETHFVVSDDGWAALRGPTIGRSSQAKLFVFDATGNLVFDDEERGSVRDVRFGGEAGPLYVLRAAPDATGVNRLQVVDRETGDVLRETGLTDEPTALSIVEDRLWVASTPGGFEGELVVRRYDPASLEMTREIVVARDLYVEAGGPEVLWPYHGWLPVLLEDPTGTRLTYTGVPQDWEGAWSHVIEVE